MCEREGSIRKVRERKVRIRRENGKEVLGEKQREEKRDSTVL